MNGLGNSVAALFPCVISCLSWFLLASPLAGICQQSPEMSAVYRLGVKDPGVYRLTLSVTGVSVSSGSATDSSNSTELQDRPFAGSILAASSKVALDPALVHAVIFVESRYDSKAQSPKGAVGLMQVMPATAARYGIRTATMSLDENLRAGTRYLSDLLRRFDGRIDLAIAAYNAGEHAVERYGRSLPPFRETMAYVPAVLEKYYELKAPPVGSLSTAGSKRRIQYLPGTVLSQRTTNDIFSSIQFVSMP